jgi:hypothetical protein
MPANPVKSRVYKDLVLLYSLYKDVPLLKTGGKLMKKEKEVIECFASICNIIIKQYNFKFETMTEEQKKDYLNNRHENDFVFKLGSPFGELSRYPTEGAKGKDIILDELGFKVSVKYWRSWVKQSTNKTKWENSLPREIDWLFSEIEKGNKGKSILICGWGTCLKWNEILQLGSSTGINPEINSKRLELLPFLYNTDNHIGSIRTRDNLKEGTINNNEKEGIINWRLFGELSDEFNIVAYW